MHALRRWIFRRIWLLGSLLVAVTIPSASRAPAPDRPARPPRSIRKAVRTVPANTVAITVTVLPARDMPIAFALQQNAPNPFGGSTVLRFACPKPEHVSMKIYNASGREVATLVDRIVEAGFHSVEWDGRDASGHGVSSGIYLCRMVAGRYTMTRKMVLLH
jgi:hypothetical protein